MDKNKTHGDRGWVPEADARQVLEPLPEARIKQCLQVCRQLTHAYVQTHYGDFWQTWLATLEKREQQASSNKDAVALNEMVALLQHRAATSADDFLRRLDIGFDEFRQQKLQAPVGQERFRGERLMLVDNAELEETIAITSICHRADTDQAEALWALQQRLSLLNEGRKIDERSNPLSPIQFCEALRRQMAELTLDTRGKIMGYKYFEAALIHSLGDLYNGINQALAAAGVLENLRYQIHAPERPVTQTSSLSQVLEAAQQELAAPSQQRAYEPEDELQAQHESQRHQQDLVGAIRLLQGHLAQATGSAEPSADTAPGSHYTPASGRPLGAGSGLDPAALIDMVNAMQAVKLAGGRALVTEVGDRLQPLPVGLVTDELMAHLQARTSDEVRADDMQLIELVGLLFDYILSDEQLPDSVKALLSYLHTPILKLAFIDETFFEHVDHPARQLLNAMAEAGVRWVSDEDTNPGDIFDKIKATVFSVLGSFERDVEVFAEALQDFTAYTRNVARRQELVEKRAMEKARGEEKLREAKLQVNAYVHARIRGKDLPSPVLLLLLLPWSDYMAFVILRYGLESPACQEAFALVDELLWTIEPKVLEADKVRQVQIQESLMHQLQMGFDTIGYEQAKARKLIDSISALQKLAQQSRAPAAAPESMRSKLEAMAAEKAGQTPADTLPLTPAEADLVEKLKLIEFGTWMENAQGKRLKVAWYNPKTMHYMLVDQQGRKVSVVSALQLAREMIAGGLRIIAGSAKPFFERALENIYYSLTAKASNTLLEDE